MQSFWECCSNLSNKIIISFELFCLQISSDAKYFSSLVQSIVID